MTINGGTIDAAKASAVRMFYVNGGSITVNGGTVGHYVSDDDCSYMGIQVMYGTNVNVSVTGGTIAGYYALYANNTGGDIVLSGGTFDGYVGFAASVPNISITDGTFKEWAGTWGDQTGFIRGGQFAERVTAKYCAEGYICSEKKNEDGYYIVKQGSYVASIGDNGYETFLTAVADAKDGQTITLLANVEMDADLTSTLEDGKSFSITFGNYSIEQNDFFLKLNRGVSVTTDKETDLFAPVDATDMVKVSGTYTYTVVSKESEGIYELVDGTDCPYALESAVQATKVTYTRTFTDAQVGKYQPWFVPFDYTITEDDLEKFTFFKISMVTNSREETSTGSDEAWMFLNEMAAGDVLHANKPYVFKPKAAAEDYQFISEDVELAKKNGAVLDNSTTTATFTYYGTYKSTKLVLGDYRDYYIGSKGKLSYALNTEPTLRPYRWYMRMVTKSGADYARSISFIEGDGETTGLRNVVISEEGDTYYTLDGVKVQTPGKGIYIKRSANGETKKVSFK